MNTTTADTPTTDPRVVLATPPQTGPPQPRNRFVAAPVERSHCAEDGSVTERYVACLGARAAGGAALVHTEAGRSTTAVSVSCSAPR
ncbi:hypothetical protein [Streptomyces sp. NPDC127066]|uniref:hypothetical protein n=1 Tax=Streptomyces sp. NPDC127066 TaxID=3347125 RepID=UPI00365947F6